MGVAYTGAAQLEGVYLQISYIYYYLSPMQTQISFNC